MKNPSLRQEPRYAPASVVSLGQKASLLEWLEENNRIIYREKKEVLADEMSEDQDISELMDDGFDDDDDDTEDE